MKSYSEKLLDPRWQRKRFEILQRDKFTCVLCGDTRTTLHVHHTEYKGSPWDIDNEKLKTLCLHCHDVLHKLPTYQITKIEKQISLEHGCWQIVSHTDNHIIFLYMFFTDVTKRSSLPEETIIVHTFIKPE
jgi:hypothetical protein